MTHSKRLWPYGLRFNPPFQYSFYELTIFITELATYAYMIVIIQNIQQLTIINHINHIAHLSATAYALMAFHFPH